MAMSSPEAATRAATLRGDFRAVGERINALLDASASGGAMARERTEELVRLVAELYASGLERTLTILHELGRLDDKALAALAADDLVSSLLLVHDLHPYDVTTRVEQALDNVRPYLGSHGGDVELLSVSEDVVRLRLLGSCDGCPSSSVTLKLAVEGAIEAAAPEIVRIDVDTGDDHAPTAAGPVINVDSLWAHVDHSEGGDRPVRGHAPALDLGHGSTWEAVAGVSDLRDGEVARFLAGQAPIVGCRVGSDLYAFLDRCGRCQSSLAGASLGRLLGGVAGDRALRYHTCGSHFAVRRAGACIEQPELHLDPLPLLVRDGLATVAVPSEAAA
jgi:Fe-S cluster biogenesis protein NfuA/nitrite reductase/ring-hydroxylating ferredoxin subunit